MNSYPLIFFLLLIAFILLPLFLSKDARWISMPSVVSFGSIPAINPMPFPGAPFGLNYLLGLTPLGINPFGFSSGYPNPWLSGWSPYGVYQPFMSNPAIFVGGLR